MHDHHPVIEQHPARFRDPFRRRGHHPVLVFEFDAHVFGQRSQVAVAGAGRYHEEIGDYTVRAEVENEDVLGFLIF